MRSTRSTALCAVSVAAAASYALPLFFAPVSETFAPVAPQAPLLARLFPGVAPWWVGARLVSAAVAVVAAALATQSCAPVRSDEDATYAFAQPPRSWSLAALASAAALAAVSLAAWRLERGAQIAHFLLLLLPPALLVLGSRRVQRRASTRAPRLAPAVMTGALLFTWLSVRFFAGRNDSRAASLVDGWDGFDCLVKAAKPDFNVVTDACYTGYTALPLILQGAGVFGHWLPLSFESVQAVHLAWVAVCAAFVARAGAALFGATAAPIAAAVLLFSPLSTMQPLWPAGPFVFALYAAALLDAAIRIERTGSWAALAAFGGLAGIAFRCPPLLAVVALLAWWSMTSARVRGRTPAPAFATAALCFCAAFVPSLGEWTNIGHALTTYGHGGRGAWTVMEAALFGQFSPQASQHAIGAPSAHPFDVPLGLLAAPFATPRTAVRLWGDAILDPAGAALAAGGLGVVLGAALRSTDARMVVALLATAMLPGALGGYDRPSLTRIAAFVVPLALLGAAGFTAARRTLRLRGRSGDLAAAATCAAIAASGTYLFDHVNARTLAASSLAIVLERQQAASPRPAVITNEMLWKTSYTDAIARRVPARPLRTVAHGELLALLGQRERPLIFWSPGEEEDYAVSATICRAWPDASLYVLFDAAALTRAFAAAPAPVEGWRESARDCTHGLSTETSRGALALGEAKTLAGAGRLREAADLLEAEAARTFGNATIFDAAARALLAASAAHGDVARAVEWASRACEVTARRDPVFCATLARAYAASGAYEDAIRAARVAKEAASQRGQQALALELEIRIQEYVRAAAGG